MFDVAVVVMVFASVVGVVLVVDVLGRHASKVRRRWRVRKGVPGQGVVEHVGRLDPSDQTEQPFVLRYPTPSGGEHTREFRHGFYGIVPVPGWRVGVLFDPDRPNNAEIVDNPHLHGTDGARPPRRVDGVLDVVGRVPLPVAFVLFVGLFVGGVIGTGYQGDSFLAGGYVPLFGVAFAGFGAFTVVRGVAGWRRSNELRRDADRAVGTVTHTWSESAGGATARLAVHPFTVRFPLPDGREVHRRAPISPATAWYQPGDQVDVDYSTTDPTRFTADSATEATLEWVSPFVVGVVFVIAGVAMTVLAPPPPV